MPRKPVENVEALLKHRGGAERACSSPLQTATVELMSAVGVYWPEAHRSPQLMARLAAASYEVAGIEGLRIPFDLCVEAEAFGCRVDLGKADTPPSILAPAFRDFGEFEVSAKALERGRLPAVLKAAEMLKADYGEVLPIYPMTLGPLTLLGFLTGVEKTLFTLSIKPAELKEALGEALRFVTAYGSALRDAANGYLCLADPLASPDLIPPILFKEVVLPLYRAIRRKVKGRIILHVCGNTNPILSLVGQSGFDAFSFHGPEVSVGQARAALKNQMALFGNIPVESVLRFGSPLKVHRWAHEALQAGVDVLAPACGLHPLTPLGNVVAMVKAVARFNAPKQRS